MSSKIDSFLWLIILLLYLFKKLNLELVPLFTDPICSTMTDDSKSKLSVRRKLKT